jgi:beta-galactosidase
MPKRVQRRDAQILKHELKCNLVRTSHYPQSRHFLDCCDEIGLLVLGEIPGWQHIGDEAWKLLVIDNVGRMIRRDWNHPSIILWGVRINESLDDHDFYTHTNALAHYLDPTRQTGGIRYFQAAEFLEDVFTMNDFGFPLKPPNHPRYLNTEFCGHTFPTKSFDNVTRLVEHTRRHSRVHNQIVSSPSYSGGLAGAPSITTRMEISAPATASVTTACRISFVSQSPPRTFMNPSAIRRRKSFWSRRSTGRVATIWTG